ncbi:MAG: hypothetical protein KAT70_05245 [Thermoplasmata archaeon]|nr:hypothetical protein [Thermoplasmata archaeon]
MIKAYKGRIQITCTVEPDPCPRKITKDVKPSCITCKYHEMAVIDLEDKVLATSKRRRKKGPE